MNAGKKMIGDMLRRGMWKDMWLRLVFGALILGMLSLLAGCH